MLDQSRIGAILTGDAEALHAGPPVTAMIVQNTNPVSVCPDQNQVKRGFAREDLFVCVHEQFMTETAQMADVVLPATTFLEHDDVYRGGGHQYIILGPKLVEPPGECRNNHEVICGSRQAARRRASRLHHEPARTDRPDAASVDARHAGQARGQPLARLPAAVPQVAFSRRISNGRAASFASSRIGTTCRSAARTRAGRSIRCRSCPTIGRRSKRPTANIRSGLRRRRRAVSSIRPSTRRRPRWRRRSGRR